MQPDPRRPEKDKTAPPIDRDLLRRILKSHLDLSVEARAYRQQAHRFWATVDPLGSEGTELLRQFQREHEAFESDQRAQVEGPYLAMTRALDCQDETTFQTLLRQVFPPR